jgi:hypothetical protein
MGAFTWRELEGENPEPGNSGDYPEPPIPHDSPVVTPMIGDNGPWGFPWLDGLEDPTAQPVNLLLSPDPQIDTWTGQDVGGVIGPGPYRGEYRTQGPVRAWGLEASGGWAGDQAIGRIMRFPANIPERYDANGVYVGDYRDILATTQLLNNYPTFTETESIDDLVQWQGPEVFAGWEG